jgi:spore cortex biosynthesis protein YabQ
MLSTSDQAYVFLSTVYAGFIIGFFYDCCRIIRKMIRAGVFVTGILDFLFWSVIGALSFLIIFYVNDGDVRFFTSAGFMIGWVLYLLALSRYIMMALNWIYQALAKVIHWLVSIALWPFRMLWKAAALPAAGLKKACGKLRMGIRIKIRSLCKKQPKNKMHKRNSGFNVE